VGIGWEENLGWGGLLFSLISDILWHTPNLGDFAYETG
jgi:hypothetical protein